MITLIAAVSDNGVIGNKGALPWHYPEDLKFFKKETLGGAMIMGRKTFESMMPSAFSDRTPLIVSNSMIEAGGEPYFAKFANLDAAIRRAREEHSRIYLLGGVSIFEQGLPEVDRILLTRIKGDFEGDTYLPQNLSEVTLDFTETAIIKLSDRATVYEYLRN